MQPVYVTAPAKLNLFLHITGKRTDGYHLLESLVVFADVADTLTVTPSDVLSLHVEGEFAGGSGEVRDNLVLRAARLLQQHTHTIHGARITLTKNIPVGAGLGGGSADAAATLHVLNVLWGLNLDDATLLALAPQLGADVAMCLHSRPLIASGVGEVIAPLTHPLPVMHAVLVYPHTKLLSKDVYAALVSERLEPAPAKAWGGGLPQASYSELAPLLASPQEGEGFRAFIHHLNTTRNDLQHPATTLSPIVAEVLQAMETASPTPALVRMTGSGSCCFALFEHAAHAADYANYLARTHPQWWVRAAAIR